jgi:hypothetical protein
MDHYRKALIIVPTYNEADNLEPLVREITALAAVLADGRALGIPSTRAVPGGGVVD